jgi:ribosomal protein L21E
MGVVPLATYVQIYANDAIANIKGMSIVQKGMPLRCYHGKTGRVHTVTQHAVDTAVNRQVQTKILAKRLCDVICVPSILSTLRANICRRPAAVGAPTLVLGARAANDNTNSGLCRAAMAQFIF